MSSEFHVVSNDSRLDVVKRFQQVPRYEALLSNEIVDKMGFAEGDLIEIIGKRTTLAKVSLTHKANFDGDNIGLSEFIRNNAHVIPEEMVTVRKADSRIAREIVLAPIGKRLRRSEFLKMVAKKSFIDTPFVEGDITYLRSKILRYLIGSMTWLRVIKTDPTGLVVADKDTEFEIVSDPLKQSFDEDISYPSDYVNIDDEILGENLLDDSEWAKINSLIELGIFNNVTEVLNFFLREGMNTRKDIFEKSSSLSEELNQLRENVKKTS
jgi:hypothetical protein